jgi:hypothetical protein
MGTCQQRTAVTLHLLDSRLTAVLAHTVHTHRPPTRTSWLQPPLHVTPQHGCRQDNSPAGYTLPIPPYQHDQSSCTTVGIIHENTWDVSQELGERRALGMGATERSVVLTSHAAPQRAPRAAERA